MSSCQPVTALYCEPVGGVIRIDTDYVLLINRASTGDVRLSEIWPVAINEPLPPIPVPLLPPDLDVILDLGRFQQSLCAWAYAKHIDYRDPIPPPQLRPAMAACGAKRDNPLVAATARLPSLENHTTIRSSSMRASLTPLDNTLPAAGHPAATADWYGWTLALFTTLASSIVTPLVRGAVVGGFDPIALLFARLLIASLLLLGTMALFDRIRFRLDRRGLGKLLVIGLISGVEICCFFWSLSYVDSSMSAIIKSTQPLVVLLLLTLGGERITGRHLTRLLLAGAGIYLLVGAGGSVAPFGFFLLMLSLLLYALQLVLAQWWLPGYDTRTVTLYLTTFTTLVIGVWWWAQGAVWQAPGPSGWLVIIVLAVVSTYFARLALFAAIRRVGSGQIALLWPLQTLLIVVLSVLFLDERMTLIQWGGGLLILASAFLAVERMGTTPWRRRLRTLMVTNRT